MTEDVHGMRSLSEPRDRPVFGSPVKKKKKKKKKDDDDDDDDDDE